MNLIDITTTTDAGLDALLGFDAVLDGDTLKGMSYEGMRRIAKMVPGAWAGMVEDEWRAANDRMLADRSEQPSAAEGAILAQAEAAIHPELNS